MPDDPEVRSDAVGRAANDADTLCRRANVLMRAGPPGEAAAHLRHALRLRRDNPDIHNSLGLALLAMGNYAEAADAFEQALRLDPDLASAHNNMGTTYKERGRLDEAIGCYEHALQLEPNNPSAHWNRSLALLQKGDYERGWREYEWRFRRPVSPPRDLLQPVWDGTPLKGETVYLHGEQGLGDTLQFCRYAALVKNAGAGRILLESPSPLAKVLASCASVDELVVRSDAEQDASLPAFDLHLPLMSAPHRFGTTLAKVPVRGPYLSVEQGRIDFWRSKMPERGYRIGICWQGNPHHPLDRFRSAKLAAMKPLSRLRGVRLYSLQRGPGSEQLDDPLNQPMNVRELTARAVTTGGDWADTAAIMANLDLVITVDTAVAHLAGAFGVRAWVALASSPDWRWMLDREDTPWYPSLRLFRQDRARPGDWPVVFRQMAEELSPICDRRRAINRHQPTRHMRTGVDHSLVVSDGASEATKRFTVLLGAFGDFPQYSVRAMDSIAAGTELRKHCNVVIGLNHCGKATVDRARGLFEAGLVDGIVESSTNLNKDPMLRVLLEMVRTPYVLWLDDDSHFTDPAWPAAFARAIAAEHPFDVGGQLNVWGERRDLQPAYLRYVRARPWWQGDEHYPEARRRHVLFPHGALFLARTEFLREHDFPDRGMIKGVDDWALGELVVQVGGRMLGFPPELMRHVAIDAGKRRGEHLGIEDGWEPSKELRTSSAARESDR